MTVPAVYTRRLYAYDATVLDAIPHLARRRTIPELQALARRIWTGEGRPRRLTPVVRGGMGHPAGGGALVSFCQGYAPPYHNTLPCDIVMARRTNQRNYGVLIHEMAHALATRDELHHGPAFCKRYMRLLETYSGCADVGVFRFMAPMFKVPAW